MWSFATRDPNLFVIPRSSSFTGRSSSPADQSSPSNRMCPLRSCQTRPRVATGQTHDGPGAMRPGRRCHAVVTAWGSLRRVRRLDLELTGDDLLLVVVDLLLELRRHLRLEVVERGE